MKRSLVVLVIAFVATIPAVAGGDLEVGNQTQEITYNPDLGLQIGGNLEVRHKGAATDFFLTLSTGQSGTFAFRRLSTGTDDLQYQIYDDLTNRAVIKDLAASPGADEVIWGYADAYDNWLPRIVTVPYFLEIPAGQLLAAGTYSDSLTINLYSGTIAAPVLESTATLSITGPVANTITLSLVDPGGDKPLFGGGSTTRVMDFGELVPGLEGATDLLVEANCAFTIALQSANDGFLANTDPGNPSLIPYQLDFDSTPVDFSPGGAVVVGTSPGFRYPILVTIGQLGTASSGTYEDVITITVTAQ